MKIKLLVSILAFGVISAFISVSAYIYLRNANKDTCRHIIEQTIVVAIYDKKAQLKISSEWKEFDSIQREQLLNFAQENVSKNTECREYLYLISGQEADGTALPLFFKKGDFGNVEVQLGW